MPSPHQQQELKLPKHSDANFVSKLHRKFGGKKGSKSYHPHYRHSHKRPALFTVRHFAGDVTYDSRGFLLKVLAQCI